MTALDKDRATPQRSGDRFADPLAAGVTIYAGAMYALDANGNAVPATAGGTRVRAVALRRASAPGGDTTVEGVTGVFRFANSADANEIKRTDILKINAGAADDQTVTKSATAAIAGPVVDVDDSGIWVRIGM